MIQLSKLLVVLASAESEVPIDDSSFINKLIPNWTSFVAQLAALVVMIILVIIIGYKPVKKMLKKRQDYVESSIQEAELNKAQAEQERIQAKEAVLASKAEASEILKNAKSDAEKQTSQMIESMNEQIVKMKQEAEEDIARSKQEALDDIHDEMVSIALAASSELLKREINEKDNARIVEDFIKEIE